MISILSGIISGLVMADVVHGEARAHIRRLCMSTTYMELSELCKANFVIRQDLLRIRVDKVLRDRTICR